MCLSCSQANKTREAGFIGLGGSCFVRASRGISGDPRELTRFALGLAEFLVHPGLPWMLEI